MKWEAQRSTLSAALALSPEAYPSLPILLHPLSPVDVSHSRLIPGRRLWLQPPLAKCFMEIGGPRVFLLPHFQGGLESPWTDFIHLWKEERFLSLFKVGTGPTPKTLVETLLPVGGSYFWVTIDKATSPKVSSRDLPGV